MNNYQIVEELEKLNQKMNNIIGRLTPGLPPSKEAHRLAVEVGIGLDNLINNLL